MMTNKSNKAVEATPDSAALRASLLTFGEIMKEAVYAVTRSDKINRALSLVVMLLVLGIEIREMKLHIWYRFEAIPVFATAMIWFPDILGRSIPPGIAPTAVRAFGWTILVMATVSWVL